MGRQVNAVVWVTVGLSLGGMSTSTWLQAQASEARREPVAAIRAASGKVFTGGDIGLRVDGTRGEVPLVVPVIKVNGEWIEVEFGGGGIRRLTQ